MGMTRAGSAEAALAGDLVEALQRRFVAGLEACAAGGATFASVEWLRDDGRHGEIGRAHV